MHHLVPVLVLAALLMLALVFGAIVEPNPPTVANNMLFAVVVFLLLWLANHNRYSLDDWLRKNRAASASTKQPSEEDITLTPRH